MNKNKIANLQAVLAAAQDSSTGSLNSTMTNHRARLIDRYYGEYYGDEAEDRSTYVDTTVRESVGGVKPELVDIFFGGDRVVEFSPMGQEDVGAADQETDVINHVVMNMNDGYLVFLNWFHDALAFKNGYVKRYWEERETPEVEEYAALAPEDVEQVLAQAQMGGEVEVLEMLEGDGGVDLKIQVTPREGHKYQIENVPPEEVVVHPEWTRLDFDGCPFVAHKRSMTVSDLLEMGFDRKQVEALGDYDPGLDSEERDQRFNVERGTEADYNQTLEPSMREILVYENYVRHDMDGDGIAELLQVYTGGEHGEVLKRDGKHAVEQVDAAPFNVLSPMPIPHKHYGLSIAEIVEDLQRVRTVLVRQLLDNMTMVNNPEMVVDSDSADETTLEDLQVTQPGRVVRIPGGGASVMYNQTPDIISNSLAAIEFFAGERESRTGVSRLNQGLDADSLNKTFGGMKALMNSAQKKLLLIARTFAETGVRRLFQDIHRDMRKGPMRELAVKLRNDWVQVDPRTWTSRSDMTVNVGLGTGDRDIQFARLGMVLEQQKEMMAAGLVGPEHIHHTLTKMLEITGIKDIQAFFPDPAMMQPMQGDEGPSPEEMLAQMEQMKAELKAQTDRESMQIKAAVDREKARMSAQGDADKLAADAQKAAVQAELDREKLKVDLMNAETARLNAETQREKMRIDAATAASGMKVNEHTIRKDMEAFEFKREELVQDLDGALRPLIDQLRAESVAGNEAMSASSRASLENLAKALSAPREIIFDEEGRPAGMRSTYDGPADDPLIAEAVRDKMIVSDDDGRPSGVQ